MPFIYNVSVFNLLQKYFEGFTLCETLKIIDNLVIY